MTGKKIKVMVAGHVCLDITPEFYSNLQGGFQHIFLPGKLINVNSAVVATGGAVSNVGLTMSKLGLDVALNGKIGDDAFGEMILKHLGDQQAKSFKVVSGQATSYSIVLSLPGKDRIFLHHPGTNDTFGAEDIDEKTLAACALLHFGYPTLMKRMYENQGAELIRIFSKAKALGVMTSLDMTLPDPKSDSGMVDWAQILQDTLPYIDFFMPSIEEIAYMLDRNLFYQRKTLAATEDPVLSYNEEDCSRLAERLIAKGAAVVAVKNGIRGYYLKTAPAARISRLPNIQKSQVEQWASREIWAGSYRAEKFGSATGAGDATIAGFLTSFLQGLNPVDSLKVANTVGWQNVREIDAVSGIEDWQITLEMIKDDTRRRNPVEIKSYGWRFDASDLVFYGPADNLKNNLKQ